MATPEVQSRQIAVVAITLSSTDFVRVRQVAIVSVNYEPAYVKIIPPIALPKYRFAAIPFYIAK